MNKEISKPVLIGVVVLAVAAAGAIFFFGTSQQELPGAKKLPNYTEQVPQYVRDAQSGNRPGIGAKLGDTSQMTPEQRRLIEESMRKAGK